MDHSFHSIESRRLQIPSSLKEVTGRKSLGNIFLDGNIKLKFIVEEGRHFCARNGEHTRLYQYLYLILTHRGSQGECSSHVTEPGERGRFMSMF